MKFNMQRMYEIDTLKGFLNSFKQFEKKLDKLQDDVHHYGNSLADLSRMVTHLSMAATDKDAKPQRSIAIQYEPIRPVKKELLRPIPPKPRTRSYQDQKYGMQKSSEPFRAPQKSSSPAVTKHHRQRKDVPRKPPTTHHLKTTLHQKPTRPHHQNLPGKERKFTDGNTRLLRGIRKI